MSPKLLSPLWHIGMELFLFLFLFFSLEMCTKLLFWAYQIWLLIGEMKLDQIAFWTRMITFAN